MPRPGRCRRWRPRIATFGARALRDRKLAWAVIAEPVDIDTDAVRLQYRRELSGEIEARIRSAIDGGHLPEQDAGLAASALVGVLLEGLIGPLAPDDVDDPARAREAVQTLTLFALRGLGVVDAHARGLVVQTVLPDEIRIALLHRGRGEPVGHRAERADAALRPCRPSRYTAICASAEVPEPTMVRQCCSSARQPSASASVGGFFDHLVDQIGDRDRAAIADKVPCTP